jgi:hypothetical protein
MFPFPTVLLPVLFVLPIGPAPVDGAAPAMTRSDAVAEAARILGGARSGVRDLDARAARERLEAAFREGIAVLGPHSLSSGALEASLESAEIAGAGESAVASLLRTLESVVDDLTFEPVREAELPEGFPGTTPVGEIEVKSFPRYRMARTPVGSSASGFRTGPFWTLFTHIKKNDIAMTAPVQMDYAIPAEGDLTEASMAFLYGDRRIGRAGSEGRVDVIDVAPATYVSIGLRGYCTDQRIDTARSRLEDWLEARSGRFRSTGELRTMEYNSPMVRGERRYFEVQIRVEPASPATEI